LFNPDDYYIVCANMLGSCYGSTNALSINPETGEPYYHDFPLITARDMVAAFDRLREYLGIGHIHTLVGGSTGGQHALEWAITAPDLFDYLIPIATNAQHSPWGIAFNESQRLAIEADATWKERHPDAGKLGLQAARSIAMLSYRSYETYQASQSESEDGVIDGFKASSYQRYQGEKLVNRFNAFSYYTLIKVMDSHHVGRGRGGCIAALSRIKAKTLVIGVASDVLFPIGEQLFLAKHIPNASFVAIESPYGHDGFLIEFDLLQKHIRHFYAANRPDRRLSMRRA
jgi:homoserine O-acetyltransferase